MIVQQDFVEKNILMIRNDQKLYPEILRKKMLQIFFLASSEYNLP